MRNEKALINLLRGLVDLLADEAGRNPDFAARLDDVLASLPAGSAKLPKQRATPPAELPDIHAEWNQRSETDFRLWLRDQPMPVLRALVRTHDFDPTRRTTKWKEAEKLADFIADGLKARRARGSSFLGRGTTS
ncbi:MAG: hypothetical protein M0Z76_05750 [Gammaproteobacteria bacterium]|nr:hypothetical protein [Gammaproteobacteria bacterium]